MNYPPIYHAACAELVQFGASRPDRAVKARLLIAGALRAMRDIDRARAQHARHGMLFISGHFPDKPGRTFQHWLDGKAAAESFRVQS